MVYAAVEICESNGLTPTISHDIANLNLGDTDASALTPGTYPIAKSTRSFEKWFRLHITAMNDTTSLDDIKVWISTGTNPQSEMTFYTNCRESLYDGAQVYDTTNGPQKTDRSATYDYTQNLPTSKPTGANLGIAGSLTGALTAIGYSDYAIIQGALGSGATAGDDIEITIEWTEVT